MRATNAPASSHGSGNGTHGNGSKTKQSSPFGGIALTAVLILLVIILFKFFFWPKNESRGSSENTSTETAQTPPSYEDVIPVSYGPDYKDYTYIPNGCTYIILGSTKDYCCMNADGLEVCGYAGQDVSGRLGDYSANSIVRFKSQHGDSGTLKLRVRQKP